MQSEAAVQGATGGALDGILPTVAHSRTKHGKGEGSRRAGQATHPCLGGLDI